jgi:hypothetical protein
MVVKSMSKINLMGKGHLKVKIYKLIKAKLKDKMNLVINMCPL